MSAFTQHCSITPVKELNLWLLYEDLRFELLFEGSGYWVKVPAGFMFDGASIPKIFGMILQKVEADTIKSAALHDYGYTDGREKIYKIYLVLQAKQLIPTNMSYRSFVDYHMFYVPMEADTVKKRKRIMMYTGVKWFGYLVWMKRL